MSTHVSLNVSRSRITVLGFNLAVVLFHLNLLIHSGPSPDEAAWNHLTAVVALFISFNFTMLSLGFWFCLSILTPSMDLGFCPSASATS